MASFKAWSPYCGTAPLPGEWLGRWNLDPPLLAALILAVVAVWVQGDRPRRRFGFGAITLLALGFVSPLCALSSALFSARTVHHVLLVAVAAPLLAWSLPRLKTGPLALATVVQGAVLWSWHAPAAYGWALSSDLAYWTMQVGLLGSAVWFFAALRTASALSALGALLAATVQMGLLGALVTFAGHPLYAPHFATTAAWGLTPLQDQQAAGLIMWAPAAAIYLAGALVVLGRRIGPPGPIGTRAA